LRLVFLLFVAGGIWLTHRLGPGRRPAPPQDREQAERYELRPGPVMERGSHPGESGSPHAQAPAEGPASSRGTDGGVSGAAAGPAAGTRPPSAGSSSYEALAFALREAASDPDTMRNILNNEAVVRTYLALPEVRAALASKASLAAYLKDPRNLSDWFADKDVKAAYGDDRTFDAAASSRLAAALLEHPSTIALLSDRSAKGDVMASNPPLAAFFSDPRVVDVLMRNPNTAEAMSR
ncbi:MAG TPA: hypothetical protein PL037_07920, partial [Elusimicrobiales bacterium]|nr:hypothetical protein [Elusimicrobiales bacterium]